MDDKPLTAEEQALEDRRVLSLRRYELDRDTIDRIRRIGQPHRIPAGLLLTRFKPKDPQWPNPLESAAVNAFRNEYPELVESFDSFQTNRRCGETRKLVEALEKDIPRFQQVVDRVFGEGAFTAVAASPGSQRRVLVGKAVVIDATPQAYQAAMATILPPNQANVGPNMAPYAGLSVQPFTDPETGAAKWALLFW